MKAFLVGLLFIFVVLLLAGVGVLLFPLLLVMALLLRVAVVCALALFAIWLLGKLVLFLGAKLFAKKETADK